MKNINIELISKWSSIVIALCALFFSFYQSHMTRLYNELSVKPHIDIGLTYNDTGIGFVWKSNGLGPAIIKKAAVWTNGKYKGTWEEVTQELFQTNTIINFRFTNPISGSSLKSGESAELYWLPQGNNASYFKNNYGKVGIAICYCSIYEEIDNTQCWEISMNKPLQFKNFSICKNEPEINFPNRN